MEYCQNILVLYIKQYVLYSVIYEISAKHLETILHQSSGTVFFSNCGHLINISILHKHQQDLKMNDL